jgi:hypothetical protein
MRCFHKPFCFSILFFFTTCIYGQQFLMTTDADKVVYLGIENPLSIIVKGVNCNQLIMKTDNGTIEKSKGKGSACRYISKPVKEGLATIQLFTKENKALKKVGEAYFWASKIPLPEAMVGNINKDTASKKILVMMGGIRALIMNSLFCSESFLFSVTSYKAVLIRNDSVLAVIHNTGARYNAELLKHLNLLEKDDQVIFSNISVEYPNRSLVVLKPLSYTITE